MPRTALVLTTIASLSLTLAVPPAAHADGDDGKSSLTGLGLSLGGTAAGVLMIGEAGHLDNRPLGIAGTLVFGVGPSAGHWYAGHWLTLGLGARLAGEAMVIGGLTQTDLTGDLQQSHNDAIGYPLLIGGAALYVFGFAYDLATVPSAVSRWNHAHGFDAAVTPTAVSTGGAAAPGLAIVGQF